MDSRRAPAEESVATSVTRRNCLAILLLTAGCAPDIAPTKTAEQLSRPSGPGQPTEQPEGPTPIASHEKPERLPGDQPATGPSTSQPPQGWGTLKARFVFAGEPPAPKPIKITADVEFCGKQQNFEEDLVVNTTNRGVANVLAWFYVSARNRTPPLPKSDVQTESAEVYLDAKGCRFEPHVCLLRTDQTLVLRNVNPIGDSAKIDTLFNTGVNIMLPVGGEMRQQFREPERMPARVSCTVHPWESGWLLVQEHPYMAVSDKDGRLEMRNIPAGRWTIQFWQETSGYIHQVTLSGKPTTWARGRAELDIKLGENDLGEVWLAPNLFSKRGSSAP